MTKFKKQKKTATLKKKIQRIELTKPSGRVSISEIQTFRTCPMKHKYSYGERLEPKTSAIQLTRGSFYHLLLEIHYGKGTLKYKKNAFIRAFDVYHEELISNGFDEEKAFDEVNIIETIWDRYLKHMKIPDKQFKTLHTEQEFKLPLPGTDIEVVGFIDAVWQDKKTGEIWIVDHKTGVRDSYADLIELDDQLSNYYWAAIQLYGIAPAGVMINYICTKPPTIPQVLKNGTVSRDKSILTDKATYIEVVKELIKHQKNLNKGLPKEDRIKVWKLSDYATHIANLPDVIGFKRHKAQRRKSQITNFMMDMAYSSMAMQMFSGKYRSPGLVACKLFKCPFKELCLADYRGDQRGFLVENYFNIKPTHEERRLKEDVRRKRILQH